MTSREGIAPVALSASVIIGVSGAGLLGARAQPGKRGENRAALRSTIAFVSTRHDPTADPTVDPQHALLAAEIYLMDGDGTNPRRLTENTAASNRSEEHTSELQSRFDLVCRLLLEKKKIKIKANDS